MPPRQSSADVEPATPTADVEPAGSGSDTEPTLEPPVTESGGKPEPVVEDGPGLVVNVRANLSLDGGLILVVNDTDVVVPDTPEVRQCIAAGYLDLVD